MTCKVAGMMAVIHVALLSAPASAVLADMLRDSFNVQVQWLRSSSVLLIGSSTDL